MATRYQIDDPSTWGYFDLEQNARPMGLGTLANPGLVFKRKFRWTLAIQFCIAGDEENIQVVPEDFVKTASRPQLDIEETEINYLNGKFWIPGKVTPQSFTATYYDVAGTPTNTPIEGGCEGEEGVDPNLACFPCYNSGVAPYPPSDYGASITSSLFGWLASVYNFTDPCRLEMGSKTGDYQGEALLRLYDGCGQTIEAWIMQNIFPTSINFGELDMSDSEVATIELTMRYSSVQYRSLCPPQSIIRCACTPCS